MTWPKQLTFSIFATLLIFAPLARGAAHGWAQAIVMAGACLLMASLLLEHYLSGAAIMPPMILRWPFLALTALFILSFSCSPARGDGLEALALLAVYAILFIAAAHLSANRSGQRQVVYLLIGIATVVALISLLKRFSPQFLPIWWQYDAHGGVMAAGPYGNHNHLAGLLEMIIPLSLGLFLTKTRRGVTIFLLVYLAVLLVATHILTLSRGGWFSLSVALATMLIALLSQRRFTRKKLLLVLSGGLALVFLFILGGTHIVERLLTLTDEATVLDFSGRVIAWKGCLNMIAAHPFLGGGPGAFATLFPAWQPPGMAARFFNAHNDYLQYTAEFGLFVMVIIIWAIFLLVRQVILLATNPSRQIWGISLGAGIGILTIILHSFVDFNLHIPANAMVFSTLLGLLMSAGQKRTETKNYSDAPPIS
ncbi:MAG: O-antigen ligase family protein [Desulfobulbaceae bacterium]|jgi:O-antigen ligase|nr:O-antigen ligase family protein [Desulfobulbaceae bacterium]